MSVGITSAILASIVSLTVTIAILVRRPRRPLYNHFAAFSLAFFAWHAASVATRIGIFEFSRLQVLAAIVLPTPALLFFREVLRDRTATTQRLLRLFGVATIGLFIVGLTPLGGDLVFQLFSGGCVLLALSLVLNILHRRIRTARSDDKKRLRILLYTGIATLVLASGEISPFGESAAALGHLAATFYVYFLYQSIVARRLVDLVEILGKTAVLLVLTILLSAVYALLVLWVGSHQQGLWLFNTLVASFVILILYDQVRPWVEETTAKLLFRERYELRQVLRRLQRNLRTTIALPDMREQVLETIHASGRATQISLYLATEADPGFHLLGYRGSKPPETIDMSSHPALMAELRRNRRPLLLENFLLRQQELPTLLSSDEPMLQRELERTQEAADALRALGASVVVPVILEKRIGGFICVGAEPLVEAYSADEITGLVSVAEACAVVIENSQEFEKRRERDRLVAIGEMAAGMAHEIRNPLGAIKGAAQCLDPRELPNAAQEFVDVIVEEVDRLNGVVSQFLEYARPYRGNPGPVQANDVIAATFKLVSKDLPTNVEVSHNLAPNLPLISIDPEQLKQVLINLIINATQAMPTGGKLSVSSLTIPFGDLDIGPRANNPVQQVLIRVRDTGTGIAAEDLPRIFVPFFTTKARGTGLGLAICQRIVENSGGRLEVSSRSGEGTMFTIRMPAFVAADGAAPQPLRVRGNEP